jgi:hypothetical protein
LILVLSSVFSYVYFIIFNNDIVYNLKIGFPFTMYYEMKIDNEKQYSYLVSNILKNIVISLTISFILNFIFKKIKKSSVVSDL